MKLLKDYTREELINRWRKRIRGIAKKLETEKRIEVIPGVLFPESFVESMRNWYKMLKGG